MGRFKHVGTALDLTFGQTLNENFNKMDEALTQEAAKIDESSEVTSYPFDKSVIVTEIKKFVTDIYTNDLSDYSYHTLRFADNLPDSFALVLYGWNGSTKTIISRATISKDLPNDVIKYDLRSRSGNNPIIGSITIDGAYLSSVLNIITTLITNVDGYRLSSDIISKLTRDTKIYDVSNKTETMFSKFESDRDYFIEGATLSEPYKSRFNEGVKTLKIYCKNAVNNIAIYRMYFRANARNLDIQYLKSDGITIGSLLYRVDGDQTGISIENISISNEDMYLFASVDWSKIQTVRETGAFNYAETGIKKNHIIEADEFTFLKTLFEQNITINGDSITTCLVVCGADATPYQRSIGNTMASLGYGYVCNALELDNGVNDFIDNYVNSKATILFFGTIRTSKGIHKHPKHNLIGYDCTLKMGDSLGENYWSCIFPTSGGVSFSTKQVISHNHTCIKGFTLDGNCQNNMSGGSYSYKSIYGGVISHEIYNQDVAPYSQTQLVADIILEDIKVINSMRGIIMGIGWIGRNLSIGDAVTDHALYLAGADQAIVENVYISGTHKKGAIAVSSASHDANRRVRNVRLRNITLDEPVATDGPYLDVRGHFSSSGNNQSLDDVFIDGFFLKKQNAASSVVGITIGTRGSAEASSGYTLRDYPTNIHIKNFVADINLNQSLFLINNANVIIEGASIRLQNYRVDRPLIKLQSRDILKKVFNFKRTRISFDTTEKSNPYTIFGIDNSLPTHNQINGLNIDDLVVEGIGNFYLFGLADTGYTNEVTIKNISTERVIANPLGTISPVDNTYISILPDDYYVI